MAEQVQGRKAGRKPSTTQTQSNKTDKVYNDAVYFALGSYGIMMNVRQDVPTIQYNDGVPETRIMRLCSNERSLFLDEQNERSSTRRAVWFEDGRLGVPKNDIMLHRFLEMHPDNVANGGKVFQLKNHEKEAEELLKSEEMELDALMLIREKSQTDGGIKDLVSVATVLGINVDRSISEIKFDLNKEAKKNPSSFIDMFNDATIKARQIAIISNKLGIVDFSDESMVRWTHNRKMICPVAIGDDHDKTFGNFLIQERGLTTREELIKRIQEKGEEI